MFNRSVDLTCEQNEREALRQRLIDFGNLKLMGRADEIGDVKFVSSDPDIRKLLDGSTAPLDNPQPADSHILLLLQSLRADGWSFNSAQD